MAASREQDIEHLLRRTTFAAPEDEVSRYTRLGFAGFTAAVSQVLNFRAIEDNVDQQIGVPGYVGVTARGEFLPNANIADARQRWLFRMVHSRRPLEEKMTLFWHNHFATAYSKIAGDAGAVGATRMLAAVPAEDPAGVKGQIELLREYALGNFRDLLVATRRTPRCCSGSTAGPTSAPARRRISRAS